MPVRDRFPADYFTTNPLKGTPHEIYKRLQWGNNPKNTYHFQGPESMVMLGELAKLVYLGGRTQRFREGEFFLAVGAKKNYVYFVPIGRSKRPQDFPRDFYEQVEPICQIKRTDYYSDKGGEPAYYYHDHEKPYPMLYGCGDHFVLIPAAHRGGRSYAVNDEGIIG